MSHVTHMNESCHTYEWVVPHKKARCLHAEEESCPPYVKEESCRPYVEAMWVTLSMCDKGVMSYIRMRHITHMDESCHAYKLLMPHIRMSHATQESRCLHVEEESCRPYVEESWVMSHISSMWRRSYAATYGRVMSHESCRPCVSEESRCPYVEGSRVTSSVCD